MASFNDTIRGSRRRFMRAVGAGTVALGGGSLLSGATRADEGPAGYLVFIYDDGPVEDYELTFQVHQEYGVPGCISVCSGRVDSLSDWLSADQITEIHDAGWEIMSHTVDHRALAEIPVVGDVTAGDTEIHVDANLHGRFEGDPIVVFDGEEAVETTVAGNDTDGDDQYLLLETSIESDFAADDTWVRYTDAFTREILADSKAQLEAIVGEGQVTGYVHPYGRDDGFVADCVPEYYAATGNRNYGGLNLEHRPDPHDLNRAYVEEEEMTETELADFLDQVANEPKFGVFGGHSQYDTLTEDRIATAIEMAQERNIEIVTLQEALDELGVREAPDRSTGSGDGEGNDGESDDGGTVDDSDADEGSESMGVLDRIVAFLQSLVG